MNSRNYTIKTQSAISKPKNSPVILAALAILIAALGVPALAQTFSNWSAPENLGSPITTTAFEGGPFISRDGLDLFITSNRGVGGTSPNDIYVSHRETREYHWGSPVSLGSDINTPEFTEGFPFLTSDGHYLYFISNRPGGCGGFDFYVSRRLNFHNFTEWSTPQNLGCQVNSIGVELAPSVFEAEDGTVYLYFSSGLRPGGMGFGDIYVSQLQADGTFGAPNPISELNTTSNDIHITIRVPDGLEIFFISNRPGSMENSPDLYTSTRPCSDCHWSAPVNLGPLVNSNSIEGGPKLSSDGTELYFMSNRPGGSGDQDLYVIRRERLD